MTALVVGWRGRGHVETEHAFSVAVCAADGRLLAWAGDPARPTPLRSTAKPIQAQALFTSGAHARFALTDEELALACASHEGTPRHVAVVARLLARLGLDEAALGCGGHDPLHTESRDAAIRAGHPSRPLHNNCSGKHAGMLAAALAFGAPTAGYLAVEHPVQAAIRAAHVALGAAPDMDHTIDGCSAPSWVVELRHLARMYACLVDPDAAPEAHRAGLAAAAAAMRRYPDLVAGDGVLDTALMRAVDGLVAKRGAAGGYAMGARHTALGPVGIAVKVHDGSGEARAAAVVAVLDALDAVPAEASAALEPYRVPARTNHRDRVVGRFEAELTLQRAT